MKHPVDNSIILSILKVCFTSDYMRMTVPEKLPVGQKATIAYVSDRINRKLLDLDRLGEVKHIMTHGRVYWAAKKLVEAHYAPDTKQALYMIKKFLEKRKYII